MKGEGEEGGEENIYTYTKLKLWNVGKLMGALRGLSCFCLTFACAS